MSLPQPPAKRPRRRGLVALLLLATAAITSAAVAQVWTHLRAIEYGYKIARARKAQTKLRERNRRLHIELALLKSPERVGRIARSELGMAQPEPEQIHRLRKPRAPKDETTPAQGSPVVRKAPLGVDKGKMLAGVAGGRR